MALNEVVCVLVGVGHLRHAPMIGAAIFELDLALLDPRFLDLELSQDRLGAGQCQPRRRNGGNRQRYRPSAAAFAVASVSFASAAPKKALLMIRA